MSTITPNHADPLTAAILEAVGAIVAREGFEGATIRRVAAQAGCSAGAVQKRFATRSQLLRSTFELVVHSALERIAATETTAGVGTLHERQYRAALDTLPLDPDRRREGLVWTSYLLRAAVDDTLSALPRQLDRDVHETLVGELAAAQASGALRSETDPHLLTDALLALIDGIAVRMLYTPQAEHPTLLAALDAGLRALLPSPDNGTRTDQRPSHDTR